MNLQFYRQTGIFFQRGNRNRTGSTDRIYIDNATAIRFIHTGNFLDDDEPVLWTSTDRLGMYTLRNEKNTALKRKNGRSAEEHSGEKAGRSRKSD